MTNVQGLAEPGFEGVAAAFAKAFDGRPAMGAALAVRLKGREVVSLWGGPADARTGVPWLETTPTVIFSCTKGLVSLLAAKLVADGRLDYDAPVASYWPEFAQGGKGDTKVRHLLAHRAGLSAIDADLRVEDILDWSIVTGHLARQAPLWVPGAGYAYHAITHGWLIGEVIRRVTGMSVGEAFAQLIARPLGADAWIGLPAGRDGVAHLSVAEDLSSFWDLEVARDSIEAPNWTYRAMTLGHALPPMLATEHGGFNDPRLHAAEIPGAGGIATARALATIWSAAVTPTDGVSLLTPAIVALASQVETEGPPVFDVPPPYSRWGMGLQLDSEARRYLSPAGFGHDGAGGQSAFADPEHKVGFAFLTNWMEGAGDDRATAVIDALRTALRA